MTKKNSSAICILIIFQVISSCKLNHKQNIDIVYPNFNVLDEKCKKEFEGSFTFDNIKISNYYYIEHKIGLDIARNTSIDSIAIVVPKQFNMFRYDTNCNINDTDTNLLVITTKKSKDFLVYNKVISNASMLQGEELVVESKTGFIIQGDWGHSSKKFTNVYVNFYKDDFFIDSIRIRSCKQDKKNKIYTLF